MNQRPPFSGSGILSRGRGAAGLESQGARNFSKGERDPGELRPKEEAHSKDLKPVRPFLEIRLCLNLEKSPDFASSISGLQANTPLVR